MKEELWRDVAINFLVDDISIELGLPRPRKHSRRVAWMHYIRRGYCLPARCHDNAEFGKYLDRVLA